NGFFRCFEGGAGGPGAGLALQALSGSRHDADEIALKLQNRGSAPVEVTVSDRYSSRSATLKLAPGGAKKLEFSVERARGWYDLTGTVEGDPRFAYRYAGRHEDGEASISDPGMGGLICPRGGCAPADAPLLRPILCRDEFARAARRKAHAPARTLATRRWALIVIK